MAMAQDRELLQGLVAQEEAKLQRLKASGVGPDHPEAQKALREIEKLRKAMEHPAVESEDPVPEETVASEKEYPADYDPPPREPNMAAPDMAVPGQREGLDARDPRFRATQDRDVSRNLGGLDAEEDIAQVRAKLAQQQRSPTAVHGGSDNLNARFGPGSPLGATPDDLPWDRPTQTDPDADPVGIVPGDRPIRMPGRFERRDPGQGIWTGDISRPDMDRRVREAMDGRGYYADKIKGRNLSPEQIKAVIERGDAAQQTRSRGSRARLKDDQARATRARAMGLGYDPPELRDDSVVTKGDKGEEIRTPVSPGSPEHLRQSRGRQQEQSAFLRANQSRGGHLTEGDDSGFDPVLYRQLLRSDPKAAADYRAKTAATRASNRRSDSEIRRADAGQRTDDERTSIARETLDLKIKDAQDTKDELDEQKKTPQKQRERAADVKASYTDTSNLFDPVQESLSLDPGSGVQDWNADHWKEVVALRDSDPSKGDGESDNKAYRALEKVYKTKPHNTICQIENAEDYADYLYEEKNGVAQRVRLGLPGWMTRSHFLHAYAHFGTKSDTLDGVDPKIKADTSYWFGLGGTWDESPENVDFAD